MIRIALYNRNLNDPAPTGIKTLLFEILRRLMRADGRFQFTLIAFNPREVTELEAQFPEGARKIINLSWRLNTTRYAWLAGMRNLASAVGEHDLYWAGTPWPFGRLDRPLVVTVEDFFPMMRLDPNVTHWQWMLKARKYWAGVAACCRRASALVCISQTTANDLRTRWRGSLPSLEAIPLGVNFHDWDAPPAWDEARLRTRFKLPAAGPLFITVSGQVVQKNHLRLAQAFSQYVLAAEPNARLILAGSPGPMTPALLEYVNACQLSERIFLPGIVPQPMLHSLLKYATAFVFPSLAEGFGIPVLEAMAAGAPVITSNLSCLPEVAGGAALLVNPLDTNDLGNAMLRLARDPELRRDLSARGLARAVNATWDVAAERYAAAFTRVVREASVRR